MNELDAARDQYERWVYPQPINDLSVEPVISQRSAGDPAIDGRFFWPDRRPHSGMQMLVAGCGTNLAAKMAFDHRNITVVGIDVSESSLKHTRYLKEKHNLENLIVHHRRIEDVQGLDQSFDFVDVSGVLMALQDPVVGLKALGSVLRPHGVVHAMVYAQYGRFGIYVLQDLFRSLGVGQTAADVAFVKQTLSALKSTHPLHRLGFPNDASFDAGIVDLFLPSRDRAYTVEQCVELVESAGLAFQGRTERYEYYPEAHIDASHPLGDRLSRLPERAVWRAMELFHGNIDKHDFVACRRDRDPSTYRVTFEDDRFMNMVPVPRVGMTSRQSDGGVILDMQRWYKVSALLKNRPAALVLQMDGKRTVRECFNTAGVSASGEAVIALCKSTFRRLWRMGYCDLVHESAVEK